MTEPLSNVSIRCFAGRWKQCLPRVLAPSASAALHCPWSVCSDMAAAAGCLRALQTLCLYRVCA